MESRTEQIVKEVRLNLLQEIDRLPREAAEKLQSIIMLHGEYAAFFDEKRNDKIELLIEQDFFEDLTDNKAILEKHYSKDNLFKELSKRQYEFQPNSNTTKKEMVDWILNNSVILTDRLTGKYVTLAYSDKIKDDVKALRNFLNMLDDRHTYRADRIYLVDFYHELQEEKCEEERSIDNFVNDVLNRQEESAKNRIVALMLCIFGGYLGLHHFYVGKIGMGILYICTVGLFGVGWLIDIVKIASKKYADKNGNYLK